MDYEGDLDVTMEDDRGTSPAPGHSDDDDDDSMREKNESGGPRKKRKAGKMD